MQKTKSLIRNKQPVVKNCVVILFFCFSLFNTSNYAQSGFKVYRYGFANNTQSQFDVNASVEELPEYVHVSEDFILKDSLGNETVIKATDNIPIIDLIKDTTAKDSLGQIISFIPAVYVLEIQLSDTSNLKEIHFKAKNLKTDAVLTNQISIWNSKSVQKDYNYIRHRNKAYIIVPVSKYEIGETQLEAKVENNSGSVLNTYSYNIK